MLTQCASYNMYYLGHKTRVWRLVLFVRFSILLPANPKEEGSHTRKIHPYPVLDCIQRKQERLLTLEHMLTLEHPHSWQQATSCCTVMDPVLQEHKECQPWKTREEMETDTSKFLSFFVYLPLMDLDIFSWPQKQF